MPQRASAGPSRVASRRNRRRLAVSPSFAALASATRATAGSTSTAMAFPGEAAGYAAREAAAPALAQFAGGGGGIYIGSGAVVVLLLVIIIVLLI